MMFQVIDVVHEKRSQAHLVPARDPASCSFAFLGDVRNNMEQASSFFHLVSRTLEIIDSGSTLLTFRPHPSVSIFVNLDVNQVRAAAHGTIFNVLLARACRNVDGHHDLLPHESRT
jgi:hypothetical protein